MRVLKNISFFLVISFVVVYLLNLIESDFLLRYLEDNLIGLLITLLAINTATSGLIASKIQDLLSSYPDIDFSNTLSEMKFSLLEQISLIILSIIVISIKSSSLIYFSSKEFICDCFLTTILIYALNILWDTGKGVFVVIEEIQRLNRK